MNALTRFFSHPAVGILGSLASLVGVALAVTFYFGSTRSPQLTYHVHPVRAPVVRAGEAAAIRVSFAGQAITGDITAVQVAVWNAGSAPIQSSDLLTPLSLDLGRAAPILEASIRKMTRPVTGVVLDRAALPDGRVGITWRILERNDGFVLQLIYAGSVSTPVSMKGDVIGQREILEQKYSGSISSPEERYVATARISRILGTVTVVMGIFVAVFAGFRWRSRRRASPDRGRPSLLLAVTYVCLPLTYVGMGLFLLYRSALPGPPFGF